MYYFIVKHSSGGILFRTSIVKANHPDEVWGELYPNIPPHKSSEILDCFESLEDCRNFYANAEVVESAR